MLKKLSKLTDTPTCRNCRLASNNNFRQFDPDEVDFVSDFKTGEFSIDSGETILAEGALCANLFTVLTGWAFRYKMLEDGRRQILNYSVPGDMVGLQGSLMGEMQHSVEALTPATLCMFERERLPDLFRCHPALAFDITWIAAREERLLDEHMLSIGRRSAIERAAYLLAFLYRRGESAGVVSSGSPSIPITQTHLADTLGLSVVHTNKTLRKLADRGLIEWRGRACIVQDPDRLAGIAGWSYEPDAQRPFI